MKKINNPKRINETTDADFYPTPLWGTESLFHYYLLGTYQDIGKWNVWEPAAGMGHMVSVIEKYVKDVEGTDKYDYGYGFEQLDFLTQKQPEGQFDAIITNPPFNQAEKFVLKFLYETDIPIGCFLLRTLWVEGKGRYEKIFSKFPPKHILFFAPRLGMSKGGIDEQLTKNSPMAFSWFIWDKRYKGNGTFSWIPPKAKKGIDKKIDMEYI